MLANARAARDALERGDTYADPTTVNPGRPDTQRARALRHQAEPPVRAVSLRWAGAVLVGLVLVTGCSREPDAHEAAEDADRTRSAVIAEVKDAAAALARGDVKVGDLTGGFQGCGGGGLSARRVRYGAGGLVTGGAGTLSERISSAIRTLKSAGWEVTDEGTAQGDAYGRLIRNELQLSIDRDQLKGSDDFVFGVGVPCFDVTDKQADKLTARDKDTIVP